MCRGQAAWGKSRVYDLWCLQSGSGSSSRMVKGFLLKGGELHAGVLSFQLSKNKNFSLSSYLVSSYSHVSAKIQVLSHETWTSPVNLMHKNPRSRLQRGSYLRQIKKYNPVYFSTNVPWLQDYQQRLRKNTAFNVCAETEGRHFAKMKIIGQISIVWS